jgi:hypothetical protein
MDERFDKLKDLQSAIDAIKYVDIITTKNLNWNYKDTLIAMIDEIKKSIEIDIQQWSKEITEKTEEIKEIKI